MSWRKIPTKQRTLKDDLAGLRNYRLARSRIILQIKGSTIEIEAFGPRKDIYQRVATELRSTLRSPGKRTKT